MQIATGQTPPDVFRGRTLSGLMSLYESNYVRMWKLIPASHPPERGGLSRVADDLELHLSVLQRCRYTTTYHLTYYFPEGDAFVPDPDLHVRVYYDARMAETIYCGRNRHCRFLQPFRPDRGSWLQRHWQMNLLLNKWLEYCIDKGHGFRVGDPVSA